MKNDQKDVETRASDEIVSCLSPDFTAEFDFAKYNLLPPSHHQVYRLYFPAQTLPKMPFFSRREPEEEIPPEPQYEEPRKRGLLGSLRRDPSPTPTSSTQRTNSTRHTTSTYHSASPNRRSTERSSKGGSLLHKFGGHGNEELDPSIVQARERVMGAESAEREADRALELARREVRDAREEVRRLELEAKEEARLAKIKQYHAKEVSKRGKALGRHDI